jgi:hypothetical protein
MWQNHASNQYRIIKDTNSNKNNANNGTTTVQKETEKASGVRFSVNNKLAEAGDSDDEF